MCFFGKCHRCYQRVGFNCKRGIFLHSTAPSDIVFVIGKSLAEDNMITVAKDIMQRHDKNVRLLFPSNVVITDA
jgi:hypothetical protein